MIFGDVIGTADGVCSIFCSDKRSFLDEDRVILIELSAAGGFMRILVDVLNALKTNIKPSRLYILRFLWFNFTLELLLNDLRKKMNEGVVFRGNVMVVGNTVLLNMLGCLYVPGNI